MGLSSLNFGVGLAGSGNVSPILAVQFGWSDEEITSKSTLLQTCSILGIAIGSIFGGTIVKMGKRKTILMFNPLAIVGSLISIVPIFEVICAGRFVHGFAAGVLCCAAPTIIGETVPDHLMDYGFGVSTNLIIMFGVMVYMLLGAGIPDEAEWETTQYWMVFYLFPIPLLLIGTVLVVTVFKQESIASHAQKNERLELMELL
jgi:MFS family permease